MRRKRREGRERRYKISQTQDEKKKNALTLSTDDLRHVFAAGHRHALGHVLALLGARLLEDGGRGLQRIRVVVGAVAGTGAGASGRAFARDAEHRQLEGELKGALILEGDAAAAAVRAAVHLAEQTRRHFGRL